MGPLWSNRPDLDTPSKSASVDVAVPDVIKEKLLNVDITGRTTYDQGPVAASHIERLLVRESYHTAHTLHYSNNAA